ncbi:MAG: glycosyltransferase family 4 protein [Cyanobacteria bacterium P01_C01_bin.72]
MYVKADYQKSEIRTLQIGMGWFPDRAGGLNRYYYDCANYFAQAGIGFDGLVAGGDNIQLDSQGKINSFAAANISVIKRWQRIRKSFRQSSSQTEHDLIISHFAFYTFPLLNLLQNRPLVTHFHGPWALESNVESNKSLAVKAKKWLETQVYRRSQKFIVLSKTFRDILHQEYQVPLERIIVIPGGVDLERFNLNVSQTEARAKLGWSPEKTTIFCIRRLAKRMGLENLVAAMAIVCQKYPETMLYIGGKGDLANSLQEQIDELGLNDNVKLLGYVADADLPLCYSAANFSVVPTVALEGFGLIVIESLAAGTPVLGTPIGGIPEILRPFSPDLVFDSPQTQDLATGIIAALSGKRQLPSSEACLEYVRANYTWKVIAPQIKEVYQKAIAQKSSES